MVYPITAYGDQPSQPGVGLSSNKSSLATLAAGSAAVFGSGFISTSKGRLWDNYLSAIRAVEVGSPSAILRTFRISEFLSPLESWGEIVHPKKVLSGGKYNELINATFGNVESITLKRTGAIFGEALDESGKLVGYGLQIKGGTQKGTAIADYYARLKGVQLSEHQSMNEALLRAEWRAQKTSIGFPEWLNMMEPELRRKRMILGAKLKTKINIFGKDIQLSNRLAKTATKAGILTDLFRAKAASSAGRLNTLLTSPFDLPVLGGLADRIPFFRTMAVKPGSNLEILGRLAKKGVLAGLAWKGIEYADYLRSEGSIWAPTASMAVGAGIGSMLLKRPGMVFSKGGLIAGGLFGLAAAVSPRFDEGLFYGAATLGTDAALAQASVSESIGLTGSLRAQEAVTPGLVSPSTGLAFGGIGALLAGFKSYGGLLAESLSKKQPGQSFSNILEITREARKAVGASGIWDSSLGRKLAKTPLKGLTKIKSPMALGFIGGVAAWQTIASATALFSGNIMAAIPGAGLLGTMESPEELQKIYSGEEEIPVRKGRWWEMGRSSLYSGGRVDYYRQHFLPRLKTRAFQKGLYGSEEEMWAHDPLLHPINALFGDDDWKYWYEQKYQYERPATISNTYGEDIPFIGPLIAGTIGKLIKPRKLIRPEEWITEEGLVHHTDVRGETEPAYHLGGLGPGTPVAPDEGSQLLNELNYRRREAIGLIGFVEGALTKAAIGREEFFENKQTLSTMGKETGSEYWLWKHLNLGGGLATTEPIRRFIPRTRSYLETYNPLKNQIASWMPKDYFLDLEYGNPYSKIPEAEIRLPGAGFCLHPDTQIHTINWFKPIKDIFPGEYVLTSKGYKKVKNVYSRDVKEKLISISSYGSLLQRTNLTKEHLVKAIKIKTCKSYSKSNKSRRPCKKLESCKAKNCTEYNYQKIEWIKAKDLEKGDYVLLPCLDQDQNGFVIDVPSVVTGEKIKYIGDSIYQLYRSYRGKTAKGKQIKLEVKENQQLWFLFGLYISEGFIGKNKIGFAYHKKETHITNYIQEHFDAKFYLKKINSNNNFKDNGNSATCYIYNKIFSLYVEKTFGKANNKCLPKNLSKEQFCALLSGWCQGDATKPSKRRQGFTLTISSVYSQLLSDLLYYLSIYNIDCSIRDRTKSDRGFEFSFYASSLSLFSLIGDKKQYLSKNKTISNFILDGHRAFKIRDIREIEYSGKVHDLEVEDVHEYISSFIVHNSALHPEVEGLSSEDYPLAYRVKILGDIAPYSKEYKQSLRYAKSRIDSLSRKHADIILNTERQVREVKKRREFQDYRFDSSRLEEEEVTISEVISPSRFKTKEYGDLIVEAQGIGKVRDTSAAMEFARGTLEGQKVSIFSPSFEPQKYSRIASGVRMKAVPMVDGETWGSLLEEEGLAEKTPLKDDFEQLDYSLNKRLAGRFSEVLLHNIETPIESLTPFSPSAKFIRQRSAIEEYVKSEAIGTSAAFWDRPIENFIAPAYELTKYQMGITDIPENIQQRRDIQEYYDMLQWVKSSRLESLARQQGDLSEAAEFKRQKAATLFGTDVFGSPTNVLRALPRRERDFFTAFSAAKSEDERQKILDLIPENEQRVYLAQWLRQEESTIYAKRKAKIETEEEDKILGLAQLLRKSEGFNFTSQEREIWLAETGGRIEFDDYIREQRAEEYFSTHSLPGPDWLGWSPAVDLQDVKLVNAEMAAVDYHDLDLWDQRKRALARKPYINPELVEQMQESATYEDSWRVARNSKTLAKMYNDNKAEIRMLQMGANTGRDKYNITVKDNREELIEKAYKELGL